MTKAVYDYGGDFDPSFDCGKLSKHGLVALLGAYSSYIRKLDGHWYLSAMDKCGNDVAYDCDIDVWNKLMKFELKVASDMMNICGDGVASVAKYFQVSPWFWTFKPRLKLKGEDRLEVTLINARRCWRWRRKVWGAKRRYARSWSRSFSRPSRITSIPR